MSQKNLFDVVKQMVKRPPEPMAGPGVPARPAGAPFVPPPPPAQDDNINPATITRVGRTNDGRELLMTSGYGTFLVDREAPTICYYNRGAVSEVPSIELESLIEALMSKRQTTPYERQYVDLLNVATYEVELRATGRASAVPPPPLRGAAAGPPRFDDRTNPATITRVGRSHNGAELVMTLGLGTFVVHRDAPMLRYFDRGREWDIPDLELQLLIESLMAKADMGEHRYTYVDLLNVATFVQEQRQRGHRG